MKILRTTLAVLHIALAAPLLITAGCSSSVDLTGKANAETKSDALKTASSAKSAVKATKTADKHNWPLFRGDTNASGVARGNLPNKMSVLWKYTVEEGAFEGTPAIVNGVVYIGDLDGSLFALNLKTGKKIWEYKTDSGFMASPAVRDGLIYIGDFDGYFHCLDAANGKLLWKFETKAEIDASANFYKDNVLFGSQDATLYCLKAKTDNKKGELVWKYAIEDQIRCSPTVVENRAFVAGCDGKLHVIDLDKGQEVAAVGIESPTGVTPAVSGDHVYFGTLAGAFFSVNWRKAETDWIYQDEQNSQELRGSPAVTDTHVIFGGRSKKVYALHPKTGKEIWTFAAKNRIDGSPVIVGDRVFVGAGDGRLHALDMMKGTEVWQYEVNGGFVGSPAVVEGYLVIASDRGVVYCFGEKK